ncbi:hypothetical protein SNEBB_002394 [Seison nebaliae]|nr:hypothetical protein SNEBB_002394 [Seison nebaliae]
MTTLSPNRSEDWLQTGNENDISLNSSHHTISQIQSAPITNSAPKENGDNKTAQKTPVVRSNSMISDFDKTRKQKLSLDQIEKWSKSTYRCTKQLIFEKLGKLQPTKDPQLDEEVERLKRTTTTLDKLLKKTKQMTRHFHQFIQSQKELGEVFQELAHTQPSLLDLLNEASSAQSDLQKNGEKLLAALHFFDDNLSTLIFRTIDDTLLTIRNYETARLEYDTYRVQLDDLKTGIRTTSKVASQKQMENEFNEKRSRYERLKEDVLIKIRLLDENKEKVLQNQLILFNLAINAYFSGNAENLETAMEKFNIKVDNFKNEHQSSNTLMSFLEQYQH